MLSYIFKSFVDVLAPKHCLGCEEYTGDTNLTNPWICNKCLDRMPYAESKEVIYNHLLENFPKNVLAIDRASCLLSLKVDSHFHELIHKMKYNGFSRIAYDFGLILGERLIIEGLNTYDYVVPVPIHSAKKRERGFNQSDLLAKAVAEKLNAEYSPKLLKRNKFTKTQTKLNIDQRKANISNVFSISNNEFENKILNKNILLVDDVLTTGSTLNECALVLKNSGALKVDVATLAHA